MSVDTLAAKITDLMQFVGEPKNEADQQYLLALTVALDVASTSENPMKTLSDQALNLDGKLEERYLLGLADAHALAEESSYRPRNRR
jgi:hypothetical protein